MSITKPVLESYINTILIEAAYNNGHAIDHDQSALANPSLRPYSRFPSVPTIAATFQMNHFELFKSYISHFINSSIALVSREQLKKVSESLTSTERLQNQALDLCCRHGNLAIVNNQIAQISKKISELLQQVNQLDSMQKSKINNYSNCFPISAIGSVILSVGIYAEAGMIKTAGKVILAASALLFVYNLISHWGDQQKIRAAYNIIGRYCEKIRYDLRYFDDKIKLKLDQADEYKPIFEGFVEKDYKPVAPSQQEVGEIVYPELPAR